MEVVVVGSDVAASTSFISVTEIATGSHVHTFKQSASGKHTVAGIASALFVCQNDKPVINVYRWHKEAIDQKMIVPETLVTIVASHDGTWLLGGSASGMLYLWEVASGNLLFAQDAHYQAITTAAFSGDDKTLVTASADASIHTWNMIDLCTAATRTQDLIKPTYTLAKHTLSVTDIKIGLGSSTTARLFTASLDQTIRIWDLATGEALTTLLLPSPVTCITVDPAERHLFAGASDGLIHEVRLFKQDKVVQVMGDMGAIVSVGQSHDGTLRGHETSITALATSLDGSYLCSGAEDGNTFVWDTTTKQMMKRLKEQPGPVTFLYTAIRPTTEPVVPKNQNALFQPFKRIQTERDRDEHHVCVRLTSASQSKYQPANDEEAAKFGLAQLTSTVSTDPVAQETIVKLREELKRLYENYNEVRAKHDKLNKEYIISQI